MLSEKCLLYTLRNLQIFPSTSGQVQNRTFVLVIFHVVIKTLLQLINNTSEHKRYEKSNEDFEVSTLFWHT